MPSSDLARRGGVAFMLEAVVFAASPGGALRGMTPFAAVLLTATGLVEFHAPLKEGYGRTGDRPRWDRRTCHVVL